MAFTAISGKIPVQPGTKAYNFTASGAITKGQGVYLSPLDNKVATTAVDSSQILFGIAGYTVSDGDPIQVYSYGNLVRCSLTGAVTAGTHIGLHDEGYLSPYVAGGTFGVVTKGVASTGTGEVLLYGK